MGTEGKNREQRRKLNKGRAHASKATAIVMAGLMATSGISLPAGTLAFASENDKLLAFAGAEGGGRFATGGRGFDVYVVTNLDDYAKGDTPIEGSLRYGIEEFAKDKGGTMIVFNVGGTIALKQTLTFRDRKNITVAGQTAPGDGITLSGWDTNISNSENLIIRYMRFRPGAANVHTGGDSMDALWGRDNKTFMIDHCSFSWNTDETLSTYRGKDGTVQWCIVSESLTVSGHSKGRHGYGGIYGGDNVVFQNNLMANHTSRNPRVGGGCMGDPTKDGGSTATLQISNNVLYNWGYNTCYGGGYAYTNYINNYLKSGVGTREQVENQVVDMGEKTKPGGFYVNGNYMEGNDAVSANNALGEKMSGVTEGPNKTEVADKPYTAEGFDSVSVVSAKDCYESVLTQAGATYPYRDAIDARVVAETRTDSGRYVNTEDEVGGYPAAASVREDSFDTDKDGIPDAWEITHGLNPNDGSDSKKINKATGYAYVEEYFNGLVENVEKADYKAPNPDVTIDLKDNAQYSEGDTVTVTANANANNGGNIAKVEFYNGTKLVGTADKAPYTCDYKGLEDGTYNITVRAYDNDGNQTQSSVSKLHINSTAGTGEWTSSDIGNPGVAGTASYKDGVMTVKGAGKLGKSEGSVSGSKYADAKTDDFQYTYIKSSGDAEIIAKLDSSTIVDNHVFTGVMFRESLDQGAKTAALGMSMVKISNETTWSTYLAGRDKTDGDISDISETIDSPESASKAGIPLVRDLHYKTGAKFNGTWFKLVRRGDTFTGYASDDGVKWIKVGSKTIEMNQDIYVGFAVDANKAANDLENMTTAKFSNIQVNEEFVDVEYQLDKLTTSGADYAVAGNDFTTQLEADKGYKLPKDIKVSAGDKELSANEYSYDAETGSIVVKGSSITRSAKIVISAKAVEDVKITYSLKAYGDTDDVSVTQQDEKLIINQSAAKSSMTSKKGDKGNNVSYVLFPESKDASKMTLKLKVDSFVSDNGKSSGVYVGAFQTAGDYLYNSVSFRSTKDKNAVSPYWIKHDTKTPAKDGNAGNGSPKMAINQDAVYEISIEKKKDNTYYATFKEEGSDVINEKTFKSSDSYLLPDTSAQFGIAINSASATVSDVVLTDDEGNVLYDQNNIFKPKTSGSEALKVSALGSVMKAEETSEKGYISQKKGDAGSNTGYILLPENKDLVSMSMTLNIKDYYITGSEAKRTGVFVGAFKTSDSMAFASLGFRGYDKKVNTDALSGYWMKSNGNSGNGSPKYEVETNNKYNVTFTRTDAGYVAEFTSLGKPLQVDANGVAKYSDKKEFKWKDMVLTADDSVSYGIALVGAGVEITDWVAKDAAGNVLYNQKDYYKDAGVAPTVTAVNKPVVSDDRSSITVSWNGEGAELDGKYRVEVSMDNGATYTEVDTTAQNSYTYSPEKSGSYRFRITGICGTEVKNSMESEAVKFSLPMTAPEISAKSEDASNTITWEPVPEAVSYKIYRSESRNEGYTQIGTSTQGTYTDSTAQNEVPYFYRVTAVGTDNESNQSAAVSIMATKGHTGEYMFGSEAAVMTVVEKSNDTVIDKEAHIKWSYDKAGSFVVTSGSDKIMSGKTSAGDEISADIPLKSGRNEVKVEFTDESGVKTYKKFNFVKLDKYDIVVDANAAKSEAVQKITRDETSADVSEKPVYATIADAIASVPSDNKEQVVIYVKNGNYHEKVRITTPYITIIGEDSQKTVLEYDAAAGKTDPATGNTYGTSGSASLTIEATANNVTLENITVANSFDYPKETIEGKMAVALLTRADQLVFNNVRLTGWQDTLQADGGKRQYFKNCYIEGCVDWIFGSAQAVFDDCDIVANKGGYVTAASTDSTRSTGYVFINSRLLKKDDSVSDNSVALGRPWRANACVTYVNCYMDSHIKTNGYDNMGGNNHESAQFYEYQSYGKGFAVNVNRRQLSRAEGEKLTVNGVFARESGEGAAFNTPWNAESYYAESAKNYATESAEKTDFTVLDETIKKAEALNAADYKDFSEVKKAVDEAKAADRTVISQKEADRLAGNITAAINKLEKVSPAPDPTPAPDTVPAPEAGSSEDGSVKTADSTRSIWYTISAALSALGAGLALSGKKKYKKDEE